MPIFDALRDCAADWGGRAGIEAFLFEHADPPLRASLEAAFGRGAPLVCDRYDGSPSFV